MTRRWRSEEHLLQAGYQWGQVLIHDVPHDSRVNIKVAMDQPVARRRHLALGQFRMRFPDGLGYAARGLANDLQ